MLPLGSGIVTLDLTINYLRPVTAANTPIIAIGRVCNKGGRTVFVTGEVRDAQERLVTHAVGNFSILSPRS